MDKVFELGPAISFGNVI